MINVNPADAGKNFPLGSDIKQYVNKLNRSFATKTGGPDLPFELRHTRDKDGHKDIHVAPKLPPNPPPSSQKLHEVSTKMSALQGDGLTDIYSLNAILFKAVRKSRDAAMRTREEATKAQVGALHAAASDERDAADDRETSAIVMGAVGIASGLISLAGAGLASAQTSEVASLEVTEPEVNVNVEEPAVNAPEPPTEPVNVTEPQPEAVKASDPEPGPPVEEPQPEAVRASDPEPEPPVEEPQNEPATRVRRDANADELEKPAPQPKEEKPDGPAFRKRAAGVLKQALVGPGKGKATEFSRQVTLQTWQAIGKMVDSGGQLISAHYSHKADYEKADAEDQRADATADGARRDEFNTFINNMNSMLADTNNMLSQASNNKFSTVSKIWS